MRLTLNEIIEELLPLLPFNINDIKGFRSASRQANDYARPIVSKDLSYSQNLWWTYIKNLCDDCEKIAEDVYDQEYSLAIGKRFVAQSARHWSNWRDLSDKIHFLNENVNRLIQEKNSNGTT